MRKIGSILICLTLTLTFTLAQEKDTVNVESLYLSAPLHVCPMLTPQQRFELMENAKYGQFDTITNFLSGKSWIEKTDFSKGHLLIHQSKGSTLELLYKNDKLLVIQTVYAPLASSDVYVVNDKLWHETSQIPISMNDCKNMPSAFVKVTINNDSLLLENQTLNQVFELEESEYRDCKRTKTIPLPL